MKSLFAAAARPLVPLLTLLLTSPPTFAGVPSTSALSPSPCPGGGGVGLPDPGRSSFGISPASRACQYRFAADGGLDSLNVDVTLRDAFDSPLPGSTVDVQLRSVSGNFCSCEGTTFQAVTDGAGVASLSISRLGGFGDLGLAVTADVHCPDQSVVRLAISGPSTVTFTSPDLSGSCEAAGSTTIVDLGYWAAGLGTYTLYSDMDCNASIGVIDMAMWAYGLGKGCGP